MGLSSWVTPLKFHVETYGCSANRADGELMASLLLRAGFEEADEADADVFIVNTCGVKATTENRIFNRLKALRSSGKKIVVAGCLTRTSYGRLRRDIEYSVALDPYSVDRVVEAVRLASRGETMEELFSEKPPPNLPSLPTRTLNGVVGIVMVEEGCDFRCSFCATKAARGYTYSFDPSSIVASVCRMVSAGAKEVWLTGQDIAGYSYGSVDLPKVLKGLTELEGEFRVRLGMMTPLKAHGIREGLVKALRSEKVYRMLHIPVQSGSDLILKRMRRGHKAMLFSELVDFFRGHFSHLTIATDVIVGFPGETEEDFNSTLDMLKAVKPDVVNVSKFAPRPGTVAAALKPLPTEVVARRSRTVVELCRSISRSRNEGWLGKDCRVLITEKGKREGTWVGRNDVYKPVVISSTRNILGDWVDVRIVGASDVYLLGECV
jgi:MiaB-like tRNA modifying enzyme